MGKSCQRGWVVSRGKKWYGYFRKTVFDPTTNQQKSDVVSVILGHVAGQDFVGYERIYAPGFHDLIFGILRDARIAPNVTQTAAEIPTLISLVDSGMGITILPASAVKHSVASVVACRILDRIPMFEISIAVSKRFRTAVVDQLQIFRSKNLRSFKERFECQPELISVPRPVNRKFPYRLLAK
jgi:LysR substrate binding domain